MFFLNGCFAFLASQTLLFLLIKWYSLHRGILLYIIWTCWKEKGPPPPLHPLSLWGEGESNISAELCVDDSIGQWWCLRIYGKYEYVFFIPFCLLKKTWLFIHNELCYTVLQKWKPAVPSVSVTGSIQFYVVVDICKSGTNVTTPPVEKIPIIFYVYPCVRHPCNSISQN